MMPHEGDRNRTTVRGFGHKICRTTTLHAYRWECFPHSDFQNQVLRTGHARVAELPAPRFLEEPVSYNSSVVNSVVIQHAVEKWCRLGVCRTARKTDAKESHRQN